MAKEKAPKGAESNDIFVTQIRMSERLSERVKERSNETGASMNSTMCHLLDLALRITESKIVIHVQE